MPARVIKIPEHPRPIPRRLDVYQALCAMRAASYAPLARLILAHAAVVRYHTRGTTKEHPEAGDYHRRRRRAGVMTLDEAIGRVRATHEQLRARIATCLHEHDWLSALILLYSALDAMGWLARPPGEPHIPSVHFKAYVRKYVLKPTDEASDTDLWGARCGMLHSHSAESDHSRKQSLSAAREIWYGAAAHRTGGPGLAVILVPASRPLLLLRILPKGLAYKWKKGVAKYLDDVRKDPSVHTAFIERAGMLFAPAPRPALQGEGLSGQIRKRGAFQWAERPEGGVNGIQVRSTTGSRSTRGNWHGRG
jgi:hypothetical protein